MFFNFLWPGRQHIEEMSFKKGDIITGALKSWVPYGEHWMLATDEDHVINIVGDTKTNRGPIREQLAGDASGFDKSLCRNRGQGPRGRDAVREARRMRDRTMYYHLLTSNCEHYVRLWTGMDVRTNQSGLGPSPGFPKEIGADSSDDDGNKSKFSF